MIVKLDSIEEESLLFEDNYNTKGNSNNPLLTGQSFAKSIPRSSKSSKKNILLRQFDDDFNQLEAKLRKFEEKYENIQSENKKFDELPSSKLR